MNNNTQIKPGIRECEGLYKRRIDYLSKQNNKVVKLSKVGPDDYASKNGFIVSARPSPDGKSKNVSVRKIQDKSNNCSRIGIVGSLPEGMNSLAEDPEYVLDTIVNNNNIGEKLVVSKHNK